MLTNIFGLFDILFIIISRNTLNYDTPLTNQTLRLSQIYYFLHNDKQTSFIDIVDVTYCYVDQHIWVI